MCEAGSRSVAARVVAAHVDPADRPGEPVLAYRRIVGELKRLGVTVSATSVRTVLRAGGLAAGAGSERRVLRAPRAVRHSCASKSRKAMDGVGSRWTSVDGTERFPRPLAFGSADGDPPKPAPVKRRGRDLNPREACTSNGFRDRPVRPLRHPSERHRVAALTSGAPEARGTVRYPERARRSGRVAEGGALLRR